LLLNLCSIEFPFEIDDDSEHDLTEKFRELFISLSIILQRMSIFLLK